MLTDHYASRIDEEFKANILRQLQSLETFEYLGQERLVSTTLYSIER